MTAQEFIKGCEHDGSYIPVNEVLRLMKEFARIKCLEAIRNTRYAAIEIICHDEIIDEVHAIQNIKNEDVLPKL